MAKLANNLQDYQLTKKQAKRSDVFLIKQWQAGGSGRIFEDSIDWDMSDLEREQAFLSGVREFIENLQPDDLYEDAADRERYERSKAKYIAKFHFYEHGFIERSHQLAIDHARGAHHVATMIQESFDKLLDEFQLFAHSPKWVILEQTFIESWSAWLAKGLVQWEGPAFEDFVFLGREAMAEKNLDDCIVQIRKTKGFLKEYMDFLEKTAYRPQPRFALAGGLALIGSVTGRKIRDPQNTRTNVYFILAGDAGSGKDHARRQNENILASAGALKLLASEEMTSDSALAKTLSIFASRLFQPDEVGRWLATADAKRSPHHFALVSMLLKLYSSCTSPAFQPKAYADDKYNLSIDQPHLCMLATSTPDALYAGLGSASVLDGLLSRLSILEAREGVRLTKPESIEIPESITAFVKHWFEFQPGGNLSSEHPQPMVIEISSEAEQYFDLFAEECDHNSQANRQVNSLWVRSAQKARQYALCLAASHAEPGSQPVIDYTIADLVCSLSRALTVDMCSIVETRIAASPFESMCQDHFRWISQNSPCTLERVARGLRKYSAKDRASAIDQLRTEGRISVTQSGRAMEIAIIKR